jgi:hypothetical protein
MMEFVETMIIVQKKEDREAVSTNEWQQYDALSAIGFKLQQIVTILLKLDQENLIEIKVGMRYYL